MIVEKYLIKSSKTYISENEFQLNSFIELGIESFQKELLGYVNHNNDPEVLGYALEYSLSSLFANGIIRKDGDKFENTCLQEYGTTKYNSKKNGRTDLFIRHKDIGIWIETKFDKYGIINTDTHWNIEEWLDWDKKEIRTQLEEYYYSEKESLNSTYSEHFIMTLTFKRITNETFKVIEDNHNKLDKEKKIRSSVPWYYSFANFYDEKSNFVFGLEVYGTFMSKFKRG